MIFALVDLVYSSVRAITEGGAAAADANALRLIRFERNLGITLQPIVLDGQHERRRPRPGGRHPVR